MTAPPGRLTFVNYVLDGLADAKPIVLEKYGSRL